MMESISSVIVPAGGPSEKEFEAVFKNIEAMSVDQLRASLAIFRSHNPLPLCEACVKKKNTVKNCTVCRVDPGKPEVMLCSTCSDKKDDCSWISDVYRIEAVSRFPLLDPAFVEGKYNEYRARSKAPKTRKRRQVAQDETESGRASPKRKRVTKGQGSSASSASFASAYAGRPITDIKLISGLDDLKDHKYDNIVRECHVMEENLKAAFALVEELQREKLKLKVEIEMMKAQKGSSAQE